MTGQYAHTLDAKGRLFIPAKLREELGATFHVTAGQDHCLSVYSDDSWTAVMDKLKTMNYSEVKRLRPMFALAADCEPDAQGRILLSQNLRDFAGLDKEVAVVGCNNHAELWDAARWREINALESTPENIAAVMEELEF